VIAWGTLAATLAAPFVFLLPGWALLSILLPPEGFPAERRPDAAAWLALAGGLTLALTPVGLQLLYLVGLKVGTAAILALLALSALIILWRRGPVWRAGWRLWRRLTWRESLARLDPPLVALSLAMLLIVGVRLWVVRGVNVGFWGDSYQHTMITQLMLDNGGLFDSWEPYEHLRSFTYHFGFQGNVALFQWATGWLTGNPTPRTLVLVGQFINALAALGLYPLTVRLCDGRKWAGVAAVLVAGLLTSMPMYYVNWGRYPQLAAQAILPVALWLTMEAVESPRRSAGRLALAALTVAGLGLTHYRIALFYLTFLPFYLIYRALTAGQGFRRWTEPLLRLAMLGLGAGLLVLPWLWHLREGWLLANVSAYQQGAGSAELRTIYNAFLEYWRYSPGWLVWIALLGAGWALVRRSAASLIAFWTALNLALANAYQADLLDTGLVNNFTVIIGLYLPVAILVGYLADQVLALIQSRWRHAEGVAVALVVIAGLGGAYVQSDALDPVYQLVTPADEQAMAWIRDHTPQDARFLVNSFFAYGGHYIAGSDAGWWIPLLAERENTVPTLYYSGEAADRPGYREQVNAFARRVEESNLSDPEMAEFLQSQGITHVYVGRVGGPLLKPAVLRSSPYYELVYDRDGVLIFALRPPP
jgi:hypothetical protein